jgi:hypothetical protein
MSKIEIRSGTQSVIATSNGEGFSWSGRVYVNGGETATLLTAKRKTEAGIRKWAAKILAP